MDEPSEICLKKFEELAIDDAYEATEVNPNATGIVKDLAMNEHKCLWDPEYPECPERLTSVLNRCEELGLLERCKELPSREAEEDEILLAHDKVYFDKIKKICEETDLEKLEDYSSYFDSIYFAPSTFKCALLAAGSCLNLARSIALGHLKNGFAFVRPPGHHAMEKEANGYCIFNNVAITAKYLKKEFNYKRILIIDWDVHHGQATQYAFYDDPSVLYFSSHRYEHGLFWPKLMESNYNFVGVCEAKGYNLNVPLNETGLHDGDFLAIWFNVLLPMAYEFNPEFIIISAGFDAALGCPEGEMNLSPSIYSHLTRLLMPLANGKMMAVLEGGYCLKSLSESAAFTLRALLGDPCPMPFTIPYPLHNALVSTVLDVISAQRLFWKFLPIQGKFDRKSEFDIPKHENIRRTHKPVVDYRGNILTEEKMTKYPTRGFHLIQDEETKRIICQNLDDMKAKLDLKVATKQTTIVYNEELCKHSYDSDECEQPERVRIIHKELKNVGLLNRCISVICDRYATEEELQLVHSKDYLNKLQSFAEMSDKEKKDFLPKNNDIYMNESSYNCAKLAAGCLLYLVDDILSSKSLNGYAIIRPPGHHAKVNNGAGFCLLNNIAIAAKYALDKHKLNRVMIIDWDVHHGDGTQELIKDDDRILFISLHRYEYANFYPYSLESGLKTGRRNLINIPFVNGQMSDYDYLLAFFNIILPVAYEFNPEFILISNGLDALAGDPLGKYDLSPEVYGHFIYLLSSLANGKIAVALEGGYNLESIAKGSNFIVSALLGDSPATLDGQYLNPNSALVIRDVIDYHCANWSSLSFSADLPDEEIY